MNYQQSWSSNLGRESSSRNQINTVKVIGEGSISVNPTMSTIILGVNSEGTTLAPTQQDNNQKIKQVIDALLRLGIPNGDIKTVDFRIEIIYNYEDSKQVFQGYRVIHMLQITNYNPNQTGTIVDTAVNNGANTVTSILFSVKSPELFYNQALVLALTNAQTKAGVLAKRMNVNLQNIPFKINELNVTSPPIPYNTSMIAMSEIATPIQAGEMKVSAIIEAYFQYYQ